MSIIPGSMGDHLFNNVLTETWMAFEDICARCDWTPHRNGTVRLALHELRDTGWVEIGSHGWRKSKRNVTP